MDCATFEETAENYLLGVLPEGEQAAARAHVADCADCRELSEAYQSALVALALAVPQQAPPASLRTRVLAAVTSDNRPARAPVVAPSTVRPLRQPTPLRHWAWPLAAAAAIVIAIGSLAWAGSLQQQLSTQQAEFARLRSDLAGAGALASSQWVAAWSLTPTDVAPQAKGRIVLDETGSGVIFVSDLPQPKAGMAYQLWLVGDGQRSSAGIFNVDQSGRGYLVFDSPSPGRRFTSCGITMEPAEGSPGPTTPRVIGGNL